MTLIPNRKAITVIVVTLIFLAVSVSCSCSRKAVKGIDIPSGYDQTNEMNVLKYSVTVFNGKGTNEEAFNEFESAITDAGWDKIVGDTDKISVAGFSGVAFFKDDEMLVLSVTGEDKDITVNLIKGPLKKDVATDNVKEQTEDKAKENDKTQTQEDDFPKEDVKGKDPKDVPRYPKSVRTEYGVKGNETYVAYIVPAKAEDVQDFYKKELKSSGWDIQKSGRQSTNSGMQIFITAQKDESSLVVQANTRSDNEEYINLHFLITEK